MFSAERNFIICSLTYISKRALLKSVLFILKCRSKYQVKNVNGYFSPPVAIKNLSTFYHFSFLHIVLSRSKISCVKTFSVASMDSYKPDENITFGYMYLFYNHSFILSYFLNRFPFFSLILDKFERVINFLRAIKNSEKKYRNRNKNQTYKD